MTIPQGLRRARIEAPIDYEHDGREMTLAPGECFVEEGMGVVRLHADAGGERHLARVPLADFHSWLARRELVFLSWG